MHNLLLTLQVQITFVSIKPFFLRDKILKLYRSNKELGITNLAQSEYIQLDLLSVMQHKLWTFLESKMADGRPVGFWSMAYITQNIME